MFTIAVSQLIPDCIDTNWAEWWEIEKRNLRLRYPEEEFFPDDYYEKMENWWLSSPQNRAIDPIQIDENSIIIDGYHRYAISIIHGLKEVPVVI
jgi:hypothetical protein